MLIAIGRIQEVVMSGPSPNAVVNAIQHSGHLGMTAMKKGAIAESVIFRDLCHSGVGTKNSLLTGASLCTVARGVNADLTTVRLRQTFCGGRTITPSFRVCQETFIAVAEDLIVVSS